MLEEWLEPDSVNFFLKHHLCKRQPFAKPQAAQSSTWIFKWNTLDRLLANSAADTLVISRGKVVERLIGRSEIDQIVQQCVERKKQEHEKLERMMLYGQSTACRWKILHDFRIPDWRTDKGRLPLRWTCC